MKSYPKLVRSELRLDLSVVQTPTPGTLLRTCSSNHGNISSRLPLGILSTNTLRRSTMKLPAGGALRLLPSLPDRENDTPGLCPPVAEDGDSPPDVWAVIKPGHVREKIAIFASGAGHTGASLDGSGTPPCTGHAPVSGLLRAVKAKGSWEENCNAKRRRRSGSNQNLLQDAPEHANKLPPCQLDTTRPADSKRGGVKATEEAEDPKMSVVDMVAFLEQMASERQPDAKPLITLQRSFTTILLSKAPPPEIREESEIRGVETEVVKVSDMVAKLESKCLRRRAEGDLSRTNSLRRTVGRVLLAAGDPPTSPMATSSPLVDTRSESETVGPEATPPSDTEIFEAQGAGTWATPSEQEGAEPLPGLLFFSPPSAASSHTESKPRPPHLSEPLPPLEKSSPVWRRVASQDFLAARQRVQQLLEPQPYLSLLPLHLLLHVLQLLDTKSLAALKCSCRYFRFVIQTYGVRPADSLWVSDPRYRDDPCKQCKRRYARGDVSLCRWHHKPYCQALPYGPGYWMCCHRARRDVPGCNVGLHDNRWVPAFHSINVPVYRRSRDADNS